MSNFPTHQELEEGLERMFAGPDAAFVTRLEKELVEKASFAEGREKRNSPVTLVERRSENDVETIFSHRREGLKRFRQAQPAEKKGFDAIFRTALNSRRDNLNPRGDSLNPRRDSLNPRVGWALAALAVLLLVLVAIGPQNAVAAIQKLIGYVPGIGFVEDPQQPRRVLPAPVVLERDGVTLTVEKALADETYTQIRIRVDGVPQDKALFERGWGESHQAVLQLAGPEGEVLASSGSISGAGDFIWAEYTFPPLPAGVGEVILRLNRVPGLIAGAAPEDWAVNLPLQEVRPGEGLLVATTEPLSSSPANGVRLVLESLVASPGATALKLRLASEDPLRRPDGEWWHGLALVDDLGQALALEKEQTLHAAQDGSLTLLAPPLDPARRYSLRLDEALFEYRFDSQRPAPGFRLPLPAGVQVGQSWAVDESLEAGSRRLRITGASLQAGVVEGFVLRLTLAGQPGLVGAGLRCRDMEVCSSSGFELAQPGQPLTTEVYLQALPGRSLDLQAQMLLETVPGPWEVLISAPPTAK